MFNLLRPPAKRFEKLRMNFKKHIKLKRRENTNQKRSLQKQVNDLQKQLEAIEDAIFEKRISKERGEARHKKVENQINNLNEDITRNTREINKELRETTIKFVLIGEVLGGLYSQFDIATKKMCYELFFKSFEIQFGSLLVEFTPLAESLFDPPSKKGDYNPPKDRSQKGLMDFKTRNFYLAGQSTQGSQAFYGGKG